MKKTLSINIFLLIFIAFVICGLHINNNMLAHNKLLASTLVVNIEDEALSYANNYKEKIDALNIKKSKKAEFKEIIDNKLNLYKSGFYNLVDFKIDVDEVYKNATEEQKIYQENLTNTTIYLSVFSCVFVISILLYILIVYGIRIAKRKK